MGADVEFQREVLALLREVNDKLTTLRDAVAYPKQRFVRGEVAIVNNGTAPETAAAEEAFARMRERQTKLGTRTTR